jgi:hypothetical protein
MIKRIQELAERLLRDGYATNEPDARLAAVKILVAATTRSEHDRPAAEPEREHG